MSKPSVFRNALFQIHWFVGITAGVVLGLVGITGAMLSFEHEIQDWLNEDVRTVQAQPGPTLTVPDLLARLHAQSPERRILSIQIDPSEPTHAARVTFASPPTAQSTTPAGPPGRPRGDVRYVNPYTGQVNANPGKRGEDFFRGVMQLHRWLTWKDLGNQAIGKQIVGAATALCLYLALSGLYLRWPAKGATWRTWLKPSFRLRGRAFLWNLHAVIGTWVLVFYLLMAATGLQWSYEWYRKGLYSLAGVPVPSRPNRSSDSRGPNQAPALHPNIDRAWGTFINETQAGGLNLVTLNLPSTSSEPLEVRYLPRDYSHPRATNTIALDLATGSVLKHERYADKTTGGKFVASIFPLHSGSFFGLPGTVLYMLTSLLMPVFTVTGWLLYLRRRRAKASARAAGSQLASVEAN
jgi:sulfite reductase (NADPH) flavoprotein alpha-component